MPKVLHPSEVIRPERRSSTNSASAYPAAMCTSWIWLMTVDGTTSAMSLKRLQSHPSDRQSRGSPYDVMRRPKSSDYVNGLTRRRHTQQHVAGPPKSSSHTLKVQLKTVSLRAGRHR